MRARGCAEAPTYPHTDPVFGSDWVRISLAMQKQHAVLEFWQNLFSKLGSTFWVKIPVAWVVMTTEPENMKAILASSFADFPLLGPRKDSIASILGEEAIFAANGQAWHDARAMMRPAFVRNQLADLACFEKHVGNLIARIPKNGSTVDLQELLYMMTMDSATDFMFGHSTNMLTTPSAEASEFTSTFEYILTRSAIRTRLGLFAFLDNDKKWRDSLGIINRFCDRYIQRVKHEEKDPERAYVFLYEMMGQGTSPEYVRAQLLSMILAGRDTTASTLSSLFWILARRPEVVARLRGEIEELGGRQPTWEEMKDMKYLNMVLKEVMRLYPTVASMSRGAARDTTLPVGGGPDGKSPVFVPKGSLVRWSVYCTQRRKDIYGEDADEFRPERWEDRRPGWEYLPFSGGPRICIGQQFALTQMSYLVVRIFQVFKSISPKDDRPLLQVLGSTTKLENGVLVAYVRPISVRFACFSAYGKESPALIMSRKYPGNMQGRNN
ncbi:Cytochrome P450 52A13 [Colletotrichum orbiculare MAFF 240422]|uniref:Cytochrome P450 52A13 n=1 Tax=Colletotrichum orbiculare (strain 104-T / ATCC 96160 / CBS 514.97 / LARS 414 / MAFF 240422) TaxID=1213857 RepID=A0A484FWE2_COLOR|nr:Cytochrome P450 52A13 [Colletotrichum orbiculare MAFF 240422]